ncbi:MAG: hypothetical protein Q9182_007036 [Xanthomendoza sp. 2 TL-2023]
MFGRLAQDNAMAQIMYGLALRHGWGTPTNPPLAIHYLSLAASSAASIESAALSSGLKKGGAAKGELVLAIYELANSYRHGWGVEKDLVAARAYYECAANLGDTDAVNEVARLYDEGVGGRRDRVSSSPCYSRESTNPPSVSKLDSQHIPHSTDVFVSAVQSRAILPPRRVKGE